MAQQTAVEYLFMMLSNHNILNHKVLADNKHLTELTYRIKKDAKQMENDQITTAYKADRHPCSDEDAQQYYNETFGKS